MDVNPDKRRRRKVIIIGGIVVALLLAYGAGLQWVAERISRDLQQTFRVPEPGPRQPP